MYFPSGEYSGPSSNPGVFVRRVSSPPSTGMRYTSRSEEHTSELQSQSNLVCRLLLEKKKNESRDRWRHSVRTCRPHSVWWCSVKIRPAQHTDIDTIVRMIAHYAAQVMMLPRSHNALV